MNYNSLISKKRETLNAVTQELKYYLDLKEKYNKAKKEGRIVFPFEQYDTKAPSMAILTLITSERKFPSAIRSIEDLDATIDMCRDAICLIRTEIDDLEKEQKETEQLAELVVSRTKVYVKNEPTQTDLLANITFLRDKAKKELKEVTDSEEVFNAFRALYKLKDIFEEYNIPETGSLIAQDIAFVERQIKPDLTNITETLEGHIIPSFDFTEVVLASLEMKLNKIENEIEEARVLSNEFNPSFLARIFKKKRNEEYEAHTNKYNRIISNLNEKRYLVERAQDAAQDIEKKFVRPYMDFQVGRLIEEQLVYITPEAKEKIACCRRRAKEIANGEVTPYHHEHSLFSVIPTQVSLYLEENNIKLSIKDFVKTVQAMNELEDGTKKEVLRLFCDYTYREDKPGVVVIKK